MINLQTSVKTRILHIQLEVLLNVFSSKKHLPRVFVPLDQRSEITRPWKKFGKYDPAKLRLPKKTNTLLDLIDGASLPHNLIAKRASDVMTQTRLRQTNWNGG